jgi:CheY-like chemotaxis protein
MALVFWGKGYAVTYAHNGPETIDKVRERPFDMIFMDMKMPGMDGAEALKRIVRIRPEATVVMAYMAGDRIQEALKEGVCGIMYKPLNLQEVTALIERTVEAKQPVPVLFVDNNVEA